MIDMQLALYLLGTFTLLLWVTFPMLAAGTGRRRPTAVASFDERREALLNAMRDLYRDNEHGHVADDDLPNIERRLILDLATLYHDAGVEPDKAQDQQEVVKVAHTPVCPQCTSPREEDFLFCPSCGTSFMAA